MCATNHFALPTKSNIPGRGTFTSPTVAADGKGDKSQYERTKVVNQRDLEGRSKRRITLLVASIELGGGSYQQLDMSDQQQHYGLASPPACRHRSAELGPLWADR
jgi:hypothetical protein